MLLKTDFMIAVRCPDCGEQLLCRPVSLFNLNSYGVFNIECSCGCNVAKLKITSDKRVSISVYGPCCTAPHHFYYSLGELVSGECFALRCNVEDLHLGYVGGRKSVLEFLADEGLAFIDYADTLEELFVYPEQTGKAIYKINMLYLEQELICTECFSDEVNVCLGDGAIGLTCGFCGAGGEVNFEEDEDYENLLGASGIILSNRGVSLLMPKDKIPEKTKRNTQVKSKKKPDLI